MNGHDNLRFRYAQQNGVDIVPAVGGSDSRTVVLNCSRPASGPVRSSISINARGPVAQCSPNARAPMLECSPMLDARDS